jgi:hypothetical protein
MIVLIPLLLLATTFLALKWIWERFNLQARISIAAIGAGWTGYGMIGALVPHVDPQIWHYATAPAIGGFVLVLGWTLAKARGV